LSFGGGISGTISVVPHPISGASSLRLLAEVLAQLVLGAIERCQPWLGQLLASAIDVKGEHRYPGLERAGLAPRALFRRVLQRNRDLLGAQAGGHYSNGSATLVDIAKYWDGLELLLTDGRIEIDNESVERPIRPIALIARTLLAGQDTFAENWVANASLTETSKINGVDPLAYLTAPLTAIINGHKSSRIDELCRGIREEQTAEVCRRLAADLRLSVK
jgi:hypothetical protein